MKEYIFSEEEMVIVRDALIEYKHVIKPKGKTPSPGLAKRYRQTCALVDQFKEDVRLNKGAS